ncbi:Wzz/FepE/Etk N-terminal domain-containing protein [Flavobacteriaceae bacterium]|nr:Wzz/FepE/Etk N-terminal domain-containing protein [Flavobacteriaceae bacterium]
MNEVSFLNNSDNKIDLIIILRLLLKKSKFILKFTFLFGMLGLFVALFTNAKYSASTTFIPQTSNSSKSGNKLSGIASLAGIDLGGSNGGGEISPALYPKILKTVNIKRSILNIELPFESSTIIYSDYLGTIEDGFFTILKKYTIGLPRILFNKLPNNNDISKSSDQFSNLYIGETENRFFDILDDQIKLNINENLGYVDLTVTTNKPIVSAVLAKEIKKILQTQIISYKTQHAKEYLNFINKQYIEKQKLYFQLLDEVAVAKDANKNIISERYQNKFKRKEGELVVANTVYQELAKQLEQAKIQVAKTTPIFSTLKPVTVPIERSSPNRKLIIILWIFSGLFISTLYVILKNPIIHVWNDIKSKN